MLTISVGDVHGCATQLKRLVADCERAARDKPLRFVFLGDFIDRGPNSLTVVEFLMDLQARRASEVVCLCGNHEDLLHQIDDPTRAALWLANGGDATLKSYGATALRELPKAHLGWLLNLPISFDDGLRLFVHAGIRPGIPLARQSREDMLWIREPFLSSIVDHGRLICHGHTPTNGFLPDVRPNRVNLDTGAAFGGPLTAAVFDQDRREPLYFIQSGRA